MTLPIQVTVQYLDASGDRGETTFYAKSGTSDANIAEFASRLQACSALKVVSYNVLKQFAVTDGTGPTAPPTQPYGDDKFRMEVIMSSASPRHNVKIGIPGPKEAIVTGDDQVLKLDHTDVLSLEGWFQANGASSHDDAITDVLKGKLFKRG